VGIRRLGDDRLVRRPLHRRGDHRPDLALPQAKKALAGYRRLELRPGEAQEVTLSIPARVLSSWDPARHRWVLGTGRRTVYLGASAGDLRLTAAAAVR
jgi:beta-glucosidase